MSRSDYAVSAIDVLSAYLRANPSSKLKAIVDVCGKDRTAKICQELAVKYIHFPGEKTLERYNIVALIERATALRNTSF